MVASLNTVLHVMSLWLRGQLSSVSFLHSCGSEIIWNVQCSSPSHSDNYALITGYHPPRHRGENLHALSDVRYSNVVWGKWDLGPCYVVQHEEPNTLGRLLNRAPHIVWKRSHSAGRWLKPLSHGEGDIRKASEEENKCFDPVSKHLFLGPLEERWDSDSIIEEKKTTVINTFRPFIWQMDEKNLLNPIITWTLFWQVLSHLAHQS